MAERSDEYELDDYPERKYGEDTSRPTDHEELKFFQENSLRDESYESFRIRQQLIESNRVGVRTSFLDGRKKEIKILKKTILTDILNIPYDEVDETKFDLKIEPVDIESFKLYYKNKPLVKYNAKYDSLRIISYDDLEIFKTKYANETTKRYVEKEMKTDFSVKSDLSALDLEVRQSESEEYHRKIDSLEREINYLKQYKDDSIEKDREIENLKDELKKTRVDTNNKVHSLMDKIRIESTQLVESQNNIRDLENKIFDLEHNIGLKDIDNASLQRQLDSAKEYIINEKKRHKQYLSDLEFDTNLEKESLKSNITFRQKEIKSLVEQKDKSEKEIKNLIDFQASLQIKIVELENSLRDFETNLSVEKTINESRERELNSAKDEIKELENQIINKEEVKNLELNAYKRNIESLEKVRELNEKEIEDKKLELKNTKRDYEDRIRENNTEIGSLRFERENLFGDKFREKYKDNDPEKVVKTGQHAVAVKRPPFSDEIFRIVEVKLGDPVIYKLYSEEFDREIKGVFYDEELSLVKTE